MRCLCCKSDGSQCTRDAKVGTQYCWQHQKCTKPFTLIKDKQSTEKQKVEKQAKQKAEKQAKQKAEKQTKQKAEKQNAEKQKESFEKHKKDYQLLNAISDGNLKKVKAIIKPGYKIISHEIDHQTLFTIVSQLGRLDILKYLFTIEHPPGYILNDSLAVATGANNLDIVKYLIDMGADAKSKQAMVIACKKKNWDVMQYLAKMGNIPPENCMD